MRFHETRLHVRFNEVDMYRVAWHGHYVAWLEVGRNDLAGRFLMDAGHLEKLGFLGPVVSLEIKYLSPAFLNDEIFVRSRINPTETATILFQQEIIAADGRKLATGVTTHVLTDMNGVMQFKIPTEITKRLDDMKKWLNS